MIIKCCKGCFDREVGCHSYCERYRKEKNKMEDQKRKHNKQKACDTAIDDILYGSNRGDVW